MRLKEINKGLYFLLVVALIYVLLFFFSRESFLKSGEFFLNILKTIIPVFFLVFILMALMNYFIIKEMIIKHFGEKSVKGWFFAVVAGIVSHGPIYMWYPLLNELQKHKVRNSYIAAFLYNRAVKIPLLPLFVYYFGFAYAVILTIVMVAASIIQGIIVEKLTEVKK